MYQQIMQLANEELAQSTSGRYFEKDSPRWQEAMARNRIRNGRHEETKKIPSMISEDGEGVLYCVGS